MRLPETISRRFLIKGGALAGAGAAAGLLSPSAMAQSERIGVAKGSVILFQGDSITDAGRDRKREGNANVSAMLGRGYPHHVAAYCLSQYPDRELRFFNRGISGHKVPDLDRRWDKDCIDLKPDVVSILVGVNDIWHKLNGRYDGTVADYETGFATLVERTKSALPDAKIMVCEPFVLRCGSVEDNWFPEFDQRRAAAKRVSDGSGAVFVPFQEMFDKAVADGTKPAYWAGDGVHPTVAGHGLMADAWIRALAGS